MASIYGGQTFGFFLEDINPVTWGALGVGVAMGLSGVGAAWYVVFIYLIIFIEPSITYALIPFI